MEYTLIATSTFGLEKVVADELKELGYDDLTIENGKVTFVGDERDIATCNMWLRTADRVLIKMAEFKAETFEELFQGTLSVNWGEYIPADGFMHVTGKSIKSTLFSVPDCQSIVKKAVIEKMKQEYNTEWFTEDGAEYKIEIGLLKDVATITMDTSGAGLHKRGYRENAGEAPLKETLAAALVLLSKWDPTRTLADPMCGSGTILIEAAMIGRNIAPGIKRSFAAEKWDIVPKKIWDEVRKHAQSCVNNKQFRLLGSDINGRVLHTARANAIKAGIVDCIEFQKLSMQEFRSRKKYGMIITNPPYGERLSTTKEVEVLTRDMSQTFEMLRQWSVFVLTAYEDFERFYGAKSTKNRKLYNGKIKCYYYQYLGEEPPKEYYEHMSRLTKN